MLVGQRVISTAEKQPDISVVDLVERWRNFVTSASTVTRSLSGHVAYLDWFVLQSALQWIWNLTKLILSLMWDKHQQEKCNFNDWDPSVNVAIVMLIAMVPYVLTIVVVYMLLDRMGPRLSKHLYMACAQRWYRRGSSSALDLVCLDRSIAAMPLRTTAFLPLPRIATVIVSISVPAVVNCMLAVMRGQQPAHSSI